MLSYSGSLVTHNFPFGYSFANLMNFILAVGPSRRQFYFDIVILPILPYVFFVYADVSAYFKINILKYDEKIEVKCSNNLTRRYILELRIPSSNRF